jgi:hypothetical protein
MRTCLQVAGILQILLSLAHFGFARRLPWREELQRVSLFTRQVFWVHAGFLMFVLAWLGGLSLFETDALVEGGPLSRAVLGGLAAFWTGRWLCQFFVYRPDLWRGNAFRTVAHALFALLWTFLAAVYAAAFYRGV